jgi:hypothetical protein
MPSAPDMLDSLPAEVRAYILEREATYQQHIAMLEQRIDVLEEQFRQGVFLLPGRAAPQQ